MHSSSFTVHQSIMRINSGFFFGFSLILMLSPSPTTAQPSELYPTANLSTTWTNNGSYAIPVLRRETNLAVFTFGFLCEENCSSHTLGISISPTTKSPGQSKSVFWLFYSLEMNTTLSFTADGGLVLMDEYGYAFGITNTSGKEVAGMNLTDTGNLVLFNDQNSVVWQSFDHPTDSLLLGQNLFAGQVLTSSYSFDGPSYFLQVTDKGVFGYKESQEWFLTYFMLVQAQVKIHTK